MHKIYKPWLNLVLAACVVQASGCAGTQQEEASRDSGPVATPVQREADDLRVTLLGILGEGYDGTLVEDAGWREFLLKIQNQGAAPITVNNVKLLNVDGRYLDSASSHGQITAPPDVGAEVAGDLATGAAGIAAGQFIPYGGFLTKVISGAASTASAEGRASAKREFALRAIKKVELAPAGSMTGSAFLPNITNAKALVVDYDREDRKGRLEIPLLTQAPRG
jgi:hypothetical protein